MNQVQITILLIYTGIITSTVVSIGFAVWRIDDKLKRIVEGNKEKSDV